MPRYLDRHRSRHHQQRTRVPRALEDDGAVAVAGIPQLVNANEVAAEPLLPSFLYMPGESEFPAGATALPWDSKQSPITASSLAASRSAAAPRSPAAWCRPPRAGFRTRRRIAQPATLPVESRRRHHPHFTCRCLRRVSAAPPHGLGIRTSRCALRRSGRSGHRPGVVRRRCA